MKHQAFEIIIVGGGHAGIEAALAAARLGARAALVTHDRREIGRMPCNPAIGGLGKGHLVKEIDALGGEMGRAIDRAGIHFRILNRSKGPAVQAPRAQADKALYQSLMCEVVQAQEGLEVIEADVTGLLLDDDAPGRCICRIRGVKLDADRELRADRVVLCTGTFLGGLMHTGESQVSGGREGAAASLALGASLTEAGLELVRLKTGTPPRLHRDSIDYARVELQRGDPDPAPFSFRTRDFAPEQIDCHVTHTNARTHEIISENLERSPLYGGIIEGTGPRYCPSIEDKVVRFADKTRHFVFLEPEGRDSEEVYVNGLSTSLPRDVQERMIRSIVGLEATELTRYGYAVEYDSVPSWQVDATLEAKPVAGLYLAGQILGTSGYEEAAAQGLAAGVNAVRSLAGRAPVLFPRERSYMGVLLDDLVTKEITEPYRMFTSRAESRLYLRCDNVAERMLPLAREIGLFDDVDLARLAARSEAAHRTATYLKTARTIDTRTGHRAPTETLLRRPENEIHSLLASDTALRAQLDALHAAAEDAAHLSRHDLREAETQAALDIRYAGYISRQDKMLRNRRHLDNLELPFDLDYAAMKALSSEAREKLAHMRPSTLGQASRIDGVRQSDLAVLSVLLRKARRNDG